MPGSDGKQGLTELHDIDVQEVSLVDAPAIRRKFLIIKREDSMEKTEVQELASAAAAEEAEANIVETDDSPATSETVATPEVEDVAKAEAAPVETEGQPPVDLEKGFKRMTDRRYKKLKDMYEELGQFLGEFESLEVVKSSEAAEPALEDLIQTAVVTAVVKAFEPYASLLKAQVEKAEEAEKAAPKELPSKEEVEDLRKRLSLMEGTSSAGALDATDVAEVKKDKSMWAGII